MASVVAVKILPAGTFQVNWSCSFSEFQINSRAGSLRTKAATAVGQDLLTHVQVYVLADYLSVEGLKLQALAHCTHQMTNHFNPCNMVEPISVALANTKSDDSGLRRQIFRSCTAHFAQVETSPELERLLQDHEPIAWPLLLEAHAENHALSARVDVVQLDAAGLRLLLEVRTGDLQRALENVRLVANVMKSTAQCRNDKCDRDFGASLETYANGYVKSLRCKRCNCRHLINSSAS
jgi:hypothetical protein